MGKLKTQIKPVGQFKVTDRITVKSGSTLVSAHNELYLTGDAFNADSAYAQYIAVGSDLGMLAVVKAVLTDCNSDPGRGGLFAVYTAALSDDDLPAGSAVSEVGLCSDAQGVNLINRARFPEVTKISGEDLVIRAELRLELDSDKLAFVAGKNGFAEILLGMEPMSGHEFKLAAGENFHPTLPMPRGTGFIEESAETEVIITAGQIKFEATFDVSPYEILLTMDGVPVMRGYMATGASVRANNVKTRADSSIENVGQVMGIFNVMRNGENVAHYYIEPFAHSITADCPSVIPQKLPKNARLMGEPSGAYLGVVCDKELTVYSYKKGAIEEAYKAPHGGGCADMTSDGSVFAASGQKLKAFLYDGTSVTEQEIEGYTAVSKIVAVAAGHTRLVALIDGNDFHLLEVAADGTVSVRESILGIPDDFMLDKHDDRLIDYWAVSTRLYNSVGVFGTNDKIQRQLRTFYSNKTLSVLDKYGRYVYIRLNSGEFAVCDVAVLKAYEVPENYLPVVIGKYVFLFDGDNLNSVVCSRGANLESLEMNVDFTMTRPKQIVMLGRYIAALYEGGEVKTYYPIEAGEILVCPYLGDALYVTFDTVVVDDPKAGNNRVKATVVLSLGE